MKESVRKIKEIEINFDLIDVWRIRNTELSNKIHMHGSTHFRTHNELKVVERLMLLSFMLKL